MPDMDAVATTLNKLLTSYGVTRDQISDLLGGTVDGGPNFDGNYPITTAAGLTFLAPCPRRLAALGGDTTTAVAAMQPLLDGARTARDAALGGATRAESAAASATSSIATAQSLVQAYREISPGPSSMAFPILDGYGFAIAGWALDGTFVQPEIAGLRHLRLAASAGFAAPIMDDYGLIGSGTTEAGDTLMSTGPDGQALMITDSYGLIGFQVDRNGIPSGLAAPAVAERRAIHRAYAVRAWRSKAHGMRFRGTKASVAVIGDSQYVHADYGGRAIISLRQRFRAAFGNGGPGWVGLEVGDSGDVTVAVDSKIAVADGQAWSPSQMGGSWTSAGGTVPFTYASAATVTVAELHHNGGIIDYRYGATGSYTRLDLGSTAGKAVLAAPPAGAFQLQIVAVSTAGGIAGVVFAAVAGCVVHNLSIASTSADRWATADQAAWRQALTRLGVDAVVFSLGGNDELQNRSTDQFIASITALLGSVRAVNAAVDVVVALRPQTNRNGSVPERMDAFADALTSLATSLDFAFFDAKPEFGASFAEYGTNGSKRPLFGPDGLHLNQAGGEVFVSGPAELLFA